MNEVKANTVTEVNKAKTDAQKLIINTEQQIKVMEINAQTDFEKSQSKYAALVAECNAEASNIAAFDA